MSVVLLSGGSGGAKLARGLYELLGAELTVIANTGDDIEIYGAHVSPDADLITYWLADRIDERGWGLAGDSFAAVAMFAQLGFDDWFSLGDRDLACCLARTLAMREGKTQTEAHARLVEAFGVTAHVLPMSDQPVRTRIRTGGSWVSLQEFMIRLRASGPLEDIEFQGACEATPSDSVMMALAQASAIILGPSNPVISIGPILALPGLREALREAPAPVVAVSPIVAGEVLKGPTAVCMAWAGLAVEAAGIQSYYDGVIDGLIADEPVAGIASLRCETLMASAQERAGLARRVLEFSASLA